MLSPITIASALCIFSLVAASPAKKPKFDWDAIKYVYAFGDSYTFVGGKAGHANYSFIGDALNFDFTPKELLSNEIIPRNTSSEGSNWTEFLTGCFEGKPSKCTKKQQKQLWNFAFAGADIDKDILPLHHDYTVDLTDQVKQWGEYASDVLPHPAGQTLTAWWIGINDTNDVLRNTTILDFPAFWELEMDAYFGAVVSSHSRSPFLSPFFSGKHTCPVFTP